MNMSKLIATIILLAASTASQAVEVASGSVACRTRAALEILRSSGGLENMPEHYRGITCFEIARPINGKLVSRDDTGVVEIKLTQRRGMNEPNRIYIDETATALNKLAVNG